MINLRFVRREEDSIIFTDESGETFSISVDETLLAETRNALRSSQGATKVNPRIIQSLIRGGKSRDEIIQETGADISDIERYEAPVLAERDYMLARAHQVRVKVQSSENADQQFGSVIAERLIALGVSVSEWIAWRDDEAGWMIKLEYVDNTAEHRAVWTFDHKKSLLTPITPDAVQLSRQSDPSDSLIPKLRAVDDLVHNERFDSGAFSRAQLSEQTTPSPVALVDSEPDSQTFHDDSQESPTPLTPGVEAALRSGHPSTGSIPIIQQDDFSRRKVIDERAVNTEPVEAPDLGQTADLLEALRLRRGSRSEHEIDNDTRVEEPLRAPISLHPHNEEQSVSDPTENIAEQEQWSRPALTSAEKTLGDQEPSKRTRGRTSIPSWDDILFGTRGETDTPEDN